MSDSPVLALTTVTLGAADPVRLAGFYERLLGWQIESDTADATWLAMRNPAGGVGLAFQYEEFHARAVWPGRSGEQQMMVHLEIRVDDLAAGLRHALDCGAELADFQPQQDVRVCLDPEGHPFCLWIES
ncbi:MAG TPA: VOC family protein [Jatrophihabitans sp.]|nr:VOC family protein [Jatrophihabitans sp.]